MDRLVSSQFVIQHVVTDMETRGRQLPDLPPDMEGMLNTSFPTVADQLASGQGLGDRQTTRESKSCLYYKAQ